ncbi:hypothetical protein TTX_1783 [Thermoproteus tenax Kra 1]|uniref:Uncharacterized protein n=1 Tax=Thermoproteus tenax (strain ATCC 35583 / DSM 2078 / JCM 9277 / NBRC 100435 / Kra 1) TaxID=768679 RepID=G4RLF8_THETK|nr:hypothetical protein TTX_1783 [Thermoproteus tenax Kra 1]
MWAGLYNLYTLYILLGPANQLYQNYREDMPLIYLKTKKKYNTWHNLVDTIHISLNRHLYITIYKT